MNVINATEGKASLYFSNIRRPTENGGILNWDLCDFKIKGNFEFSRNAIEWAMMATQPMMLQTSVIRRESYLEVGGLPENLLTGEDTLLFYKLCFGNPACAVSGCGTIMTAGGQNDTRLTVRFNSQTSVYWSSRISIYKELLSCEHKMDHVQRKSIMESMIRSHIAISQVFLREKKIYRMLENLCVASLINPSLFAKNMILKIKRFFSKKIKNG